MKNRLSDRLQKNPITRNGVPKLVSFLFAILLWVYVLDVENPEMIKVIKNVEVGVVGAEQVEAAGLVLIGQTLPGIDVTIKGRRSDISDLDRNDIALSLNVNNLQKGSHEVEIDKSMLVPNVTIVSLSKRSIELTIDTLVEQLKPVEIEFTGQVQPGFVAEVAVPDPPMVLVKGPEQLVTKVSKLLGQVDSASLTANTEAQIPIKPVTASGESVDGLQVASRSVKAVLSLSQLKTMTITPTFSGSLPQGFELADVRFVPETVALKGDAKALQALSVLKTRAISLSAMQESGTVTVELDLPEGVSIHEPTVPLKAQLRVEAIKTREILYTPEEVHLLNPAAGTAGKLTGPVKVKVKGIASLVDSLGKEDLKIQADLSSQGPGIVEVALQFTLTAPYERLQVDPGRAQVSIYSQ